jgi:mevalonate kinase
LYVNEAERFNELHSKLLQQKNSIAIYLKEHQQTDITKSDKELVNASKAAMRGLKESINIIENQLSRIIEQEKLNKLYILIKSVPVLVN